MMDIGSVADKRVAIGTYVALSICDQLQLEVSAHQYEQGNRAGKIALNCKSLAQT